MYYLPATGWAWWPILIATALSGGVIYVAFRANRWTSLKLPTSFFEGPAFANAGTVSTLMSLLPILLSNEVRTDTVSASLLGTAALLFSLGTFVALWLYSVVSAKARNDEIELKNPLLIALQGVVVMLMIVASGCFITFVMFTPLLG